MSEHTATISWQRHQAQFIDHHYSREHTWKFDGGMEILASASPQVVPVPYANPAHVDPEEAFVAALSSCHMLWFLSIAAKQKFTVDSYTDQAVGIMGKNSQGKTMIKQVKLRPRVVFSQDNQPTKPQLQQMHKAAHYSCFLASSVTTEIIIEAIDGPVR
jgi:organic hydroperoxide reductase OsmC/OhrA